MNTKLLYDYVSKMLKDEALNKQEKSELLSEWRIKTKGAIRVGILSSADIKEASEFLAQLSQWQSSLANEPETKYESAVKAMLDEQSETPETDEIEFQQECNFEVCWEDFARKLESEKNNALKTLKEISKKDYQDAGERAIAWNKLKDQRDEALRQNEILSKFINSEMRMTAEDPRLLKLKEQLEAL